jgi:hypothetical protein
MVGTTSSALAVTTYTDSSPFISDQFDGTSLNTFLWDSGGDSATVHDGYLDMQANQTDNTGWVKASFSERQHVRVELLHKMHPANDYFFPSIILGATNPNGLVAVRWLRSNYGPDYCNSSSHYDRVDVLAGYDGNATCAWTASNLVSSSYFDRWITSIIDYDSTTGIVTLDVDGDGNVDFTATVDPANRSPITSLQMHGYGWWTGHSHQVDYIKVFEISAQTTPYQINVYKAGTGTGVVSSPAGSGLYCGTVCSVVYTSGTSVTLTATAATGSTFAGWSGDCSGTASTCTVSMSQARNVGATFTVNTTPNAAPVANAGVAQSVVVRSAVTLDGSASSDANGDPLTYAWTMTSKPTGSAALLLGASLAKTTFLADVAGTYVVSLIVNDGKVNSAAATTTVTATGPASTLSKCVVYAPLTLYQGKFTNAQYDQIRIGASSTPQEIDQLFGCIGDRQSSTATLAGTYEVWSWIGDDNKQGVGVSFLDNVVYGKTKTGF